MLGTGKTPKPHNHRPTRMIMADQPYPLSQKSRKQEVVKINPKSNIQDKYNKLKNKILLNKYNKSIKRTELLIKTYYISIRHLK